MNMIQVARALNKRTIVSSAGGGTINVLAGALATRTRCSFGDAVRLLNAKVDGGELHLSAPCPGADIESQWAEIEASTDAAIAAMNKVSAK